MSGTLSNSFLLNSNRNPLTEGGALHEVMVRFLDCNQSQKLHWIYSLRNGDAGVYLQCEPPANSPVLNPPAVALATSSVEQIRTRCGDFSTLYHAERREAIFMGSKNNMAFSWVIEPGSETAEILTYAATNFLLTMDFKHRILRLSVNLKDNTLLNAELNLNSFGMVQLFPHSLQTRFNEVCITNLLLDLYRKLFSSLPEDAQTFFFEPKLLSNNLAFRSAFYAYKNSRSQHNEVEVLVTSKGATALNIPEGLYYCELPSAVRSGYRLYQKKNSFFSNKEINIHNLEKDEDMAMHIIDGHIKNEKPHCSLSAFDNLGDTNNV